MKMPGVRSAGHFRTGYRKHQTLNALLGTKIMSVTTEIAGTPKKTRSELAEQLSFSTEQLQLMKDTVAKGVSDNEFMLFLHLAKTYGLDPFAKEVWCIKYGNNPATIFTSRDGYLKIASRDKQMNGIVSDAVCEGDTVERLADGHVLHTYGNPRGKLVGAYALVHRKDRAYPAYFYAPLTEYCAGSNPTWKKYPTAMIIKVAEAMALKRAFSISGLVTQEEIGLDMQAEPDAGTGAEVVVEPTTAPAPVMVATTTLAATEPSDEAQLAGHRTRLLYARSIAEVQQIWGEIAGRLKPQLVKEKDAAKARVQKKPAAKAPVRDEQLMREFVEQPELGMGQPATAAQQQEILRIINLQTITAGEKADMLKVLYKLDEVRAGQAIFKLLNEIGVREGRDSDKEMRQALHRFITNYSEQLGSDGVNRLTALNEDSGVHWQTLRAELVAARDGFFVAAA
jgi:phage recombination protein Bet